MIYSLRFFNLKELYTKKEHISVHFFYFKNGRKYARNSVTIEYKTYKNCAFFCYQLLNYLNLILNLIYLKKTLFFGKFSFLLLCVLMSLCIILLLQSIKYFEDKIFKPFFVSHFIVFFCFHSFIEPLKIQSLFFKIIAVYN